MKSYLLAILWTLVFALTLRGDNHPASPLPHLAYNSSAEEINKYEVLVNKWNSSPELMDSLSGPQLIQLCMQVGALPAKNEMSSKTWLQLRGAETRLIGLIIASLTKRIDPQIDVGRPMGGYLPYEYTVPVSDQNNDAKHSAYEAQVRLSSKKDKIEYEQIVLRKQLDIVTSCGASYLEAVYANSAEEFRFALPILRHAGVSVEVLPQVIKRDDRQ